ncbi:Clp protease ClpP [Paenibacillus dokdonensis]|uniref:ATP-dependent Clp protease proteolytic subunit n=1 Tax=Paenibacillus dokdonensis TaxID=2567944 RepID=A0ABU6GTS8_9BACL|nr:head maturation protease, ClpP-related [Paenibacillus dokdonensis]MEC0242774.1 Clp protease ClpP [Paenibacillus dokdonensis]
MSDQQRKKYWDFKAAASGEGELYIYGDIVSWQWDDSDTSANSFKKDLDALGDIHTLKLYINSPGGSVFEGVAIHNILKRHKAYKIAHIDGLAASISSLIPMACDETHMPSNAMMMVHRPWNFVVGNASELRKAADDLDRICESMKQSYLDRAGDKLSEEKLTELLEVESWLTAKECFNYGLCNVVGEANKAAACVSEELFAKYRNVPQDIAAKLSDPEVPKASGNDEETAAYLQRIKDTAGLELQNINSYLGGIING